MTARLTADRRALLVAMLSRRSPLVRGNFRWFVPGWGGTIEAKDVEALISLGHLGYRSASRRVLDLTATGRAVAEAATGGKAAGKAAE